MPRFDDDGPPYVRRLVAYSAPSGTTLLPPVPYTAFQVKPETRRSRNRRPAVPPEHRSWLSLSEVAELLGVSTKTVQRSGIPRTKFCRRPRFNREVVERYMIERQEVPIRPELATPASPTKPILSQPKQLNRKSDKGKRAAELLKLLEEKGG
jgi:hypothetical protein